MTMNIHEIKPHTLVSLKTKTQTFQGRLLPQEGEYIVLKLSSGYNIGIHPKKIEHIEELVEESHDITTTHLIAQDSSLPTVTIMHTGGTIASKVDYKTGGVIADFEPEALLGLFPELSDVAYIQSEFLGNMFSDDFRFSHFNKIAQAIHKQAQEGVQRFIVTSGTDFLHYLSAGLSFILKDLPIGVLVVGSQRSSDRGSSDAAMNLICATQFLATTHFCGVGVCMHENTNDDSCLIIPGINARKMHSSRRDAFKPINTAPYARVHYQEKNVTLLRDIPSCPDDGAVVKKISLLKEDLKIGLLYAHPNMCPEEFLAYKTFDGLVLAGSGLGHIPITQVDDSTKDHKKNLSAILELISRMPVVMSTQTVYGRVHMNVYAPARALKDAGIIGHLNALTPETSYMKLAWLLSTFDKKEIAGLFEKDFIGESHSITQEHFY
jgi:glutamyl-tRNA(Gln) amidotransferase subunit D